MNKSFLSLFIMVCLFLPADLFAGTKDPGGNEIDPIVITLQNYKTEGYTILGPVQYLGRTKNQISLYRIPPVSYTRLRVINKIGIATSVERGQFVYVVSKNGRVILIRLKKKEIEDA